MAIEAVVGALLGGLAGFGVSELAASSKAPDKPTPPNNPAAPAGQNDANKQAAAQVANQRETLLAAGGITDYTGGMGILANQDVNKNVLIGG